jgi:hypothetical protein
MGEVADYRKITAYGINDAGQIVGYMINNIRRRASRAPADPGNKEQSKNGLTGNKKRKLRT